MFKSIKLVMVLLVGMLLFAGCGGSGGSDDTKTSLVDSSDSEAPKITMSGKSSLTIIEGTTYTDAGATAKDAVDGTVKVTISGSVNSSKVGTYIITYTAVDKAGNKAIKTRKVTVVLPPDTTPPVITIIGDNPLEITQGKTFSDPGATAIDDKDGVVTITSTGSVDMSTIGNYTITYTATDNAGNKSTATRTVEVIKISNQLPIANAGEDKYVMVNNSILLTGIVTDCDETIVSYEWKEGNKVLASTALFSYKPVTYGKHTLTLKVTDNSGGEGSDNIVINACAPKPTSSYILDKKDGVFLSFAESGYDVVKEENMPLHSNGSFQTADVNNWTTEAISTIDYKIGTKMEVFASKMWWGGDRCPMTIEFLDSSSNVIGSIEFNPQQYSGNSVYFYKNGEITYTHNDNNQSIESPQYDGQFYGYFEFMSNKIKFNSYYSEKSFGTSFEVDYDLSNIKYIRSTTQALGTYYKGRAISYTKLLPNDMGINLTNGLVAHYEFEGNANDSSGNENDGTEYGGVSYTDGVIGKAGSFDGVDDYISLNKKFIVGHESFTFSSWIKPELFDSQWGRSFYAEQNSNEFSKFNMQLKDNQIQVFGRYNSTDNNFRIPIQSNIENNFYYLTIIKKENILSYYIQHLSQKPPPKPPFP